MVLQLSAWLYGSALAKLVGEVLVERLGVNLFPLMTEVLMPMELAPEKTFDVLVFGLSILVAIGVYVANIWLRKKNEVKVSFLEWLFLGFSVLFFWQAWFVHSAKITTMLVAGAVFVLYLGVRYFQHEEFNFKTNFPWQNGVLAGYWLMTTSSLLTTSLLLRLSLWLGTIGLYYLLFNWIKSEKFQRFLGSPVQILLLISLFLPVTSLLLFGTGVMILSLVWGYFIIRDFKLGFVYDAAMVTLMSFNLRFYVGNYDFIEEGVWLGWLQRLDEGMVMYRDFWVYHPPLIPKFVYWVTQIFGESVFSLRLAFQILRVLGLIFYFYLIKEVTDSRILRVILFLMGLGITSTLVRNNVEIRVGMALLAILCWHKALNISKIKESKYWLVGSGIMTGIAGLTSLEVGAAVAISLVIVILLFGGKERFSRLGWWFVGGLMVGIPVIIRMATEGALLPAIEQLSFYSSAFSAGYFNVAIPGTPESAFYQWSLFDEYLSSWLFGWELTKLGLLLGMFLVIKRVLEKKEFEKKDKLVMVLSIFGLIVSRGTLGRSDWYHLLFSLLISFVLIAIVLERAVGTNKAIFAMGILLIVFARNNGLRVHLDNLFLNWQTHGQVLGSVQNYEFERMGVKVDVGVEVYKLNEIVAYLDNLPKEQEIFMFPWMPDLYFFSEIKNPTKNDLPYSFFTEEYQKETIKDLEENANALVVFNPLRSLDGFDAARLKYLNQYIQDNYETVDQIGMFQIMRRSGVDF